MSLFFEEEIKKMKEKANSSELLEILSQDPRSEGRVSSKNNELPFRGPTRRSASSRFRRW